ncbi:MAG: MFS transporter, partial [Pseudohongiella sp.]|nr:MFS transporter [Pseudohongiella sp.]
MTVQQTAAAPPIDEHTKSNMRKVALTSLAGTSIEWYDFFLYGTAAALVFPILFFPADMPPMVALIASFSTFAV